MRKKYVFIACFFSSMAHAGDPAYHDVNGWTTLGHTPAELCIHLAAPAKIWNHTPRYPGDQVQWEYKVWDSSIDYETKKACEQVKTADQANCVKRASVYRWVDGKRVVMVPGDFAHCIHLTHVD